MAGNSDMSTTNSTAFDPMAQYARLSERVENQGKDIVDLRSNMNTGFQSVNANIAALSNELRSSSKTPWPVIWSAAGVCSAILFTGGTFVYGTLSSNLNELKQDVRTQSIEVRTSIAKLADQTVTQQEMQWRTARGAEDRALTQGAISDIRKEQVPRGELERVWANYDQRFIDQQRQLDVLSTNYNNTYNPRDAIQDMRERIDRLERLKQSAVTPGG